jgi:DNA-binding PadR family transcriptional regulator
LTGEAEEELIRTVVAGFSRAIILWLVKQKPTSGYRVVKELELLTKQKLTSGVVYPLLYELEKDGYIVGQWTQKGVRRTKYYSMTPAGLDAWNRLCRLFDMPMKEALKDFITKK